ncbi:MAG: hypothetical protein NVSMB57_12350 [Actinomycetota bacterium]
MKVLHRRVNVKTSAASHGSGFAEAESRPEASRELCDSLLLFGLAATSLGAYVGIAFAAVRMLGTR